MAHEIESNAYVGDTPWHGLGTQLTEGATPEEMLVAAGLDWRIIKRAMWTTKESGGTLPVDEFFALVRDMDASVIGICGKGYVPFQNEEVFRFFKKYCDLGKLQMETAGSLSGGKYVWGLAKVNSFSVGQDKINSYLLLCQPHIWGKAMTVMYTSVRVVCMNTMVMALNGPGEKLHVPHIRAFDSELAESVGEALFLAETQTDALKEKVTFLAEVKAERAAQLRYVATLMQPGLLEQETINHYDLNNSAYKAFEAISSSPGHDTIVDGHKASETWWGSLNGITYFIDHMYGKDQDRRLQNSWLGQGARLKRVALDTAVEFAKVAAA